ncbi:MAG: YbaB/EbfC family nucleoid-associated protein [Myxococcaceae bacterium]|nr:YbaB/EbfC family nucleoid-associated protein [Myxococcaceae bacterium]
MPGIDLNYFIRQANKLTEKIEARTQELANETVEASSGEGRVTVVANGVQEIRSIKIDKSAIDPNDTGMLEDLITAAVNAALASSREYKQKELAKISGGVKIPGIT